MLYLSACSNRSRGGLFWRRQCRSDSQIPISSVLFLNGREIGLADALAVTFTFFVHSDAIAADCSLGERVASAIASSSRSSFSINAKMTLTCSSGGASSNSSIRARARSLSVGMEIFFFCFAVMTFLFAYASEQIFRATKQLLRANPR
jgi:hypothetical protein